MKDFFGDECELTGAFRATRKLGLRRMFIQNPDAFAESQRCYGLRFADRMLRDAREEFGALGRKIPLHFPLDLKSIECFAIDMRGTTSPLGWRYLFDVQHQPIPADPKDEAKQKIIAKDDDAWMDGDEGVKESPAEAKPAEFVTSFTGSDLALVFAAYDNKSPIYKTMAASVEEVASQFLTPQALARATIKNVSSSRLSFKRQP
jgi:hypothetical protein